MVALLNCYPTLDEVMKFHETVADPDDYGILMMHGKNGSILYALVPKSALKELER